MIDFKNLATIVMCHAVGDYVLQNDFLAKTKGDNFYHLLMHCILYCIPFAVVYGIDYKIVILFVMHVWIDWEKCKGIIGYVEDQILHYAIAIALY